MSEMHEYMIYIYISYHMYNKIWTNELRTVAVNLRLCGNVVDI